MYKKPTVRQKYSHSKSGHPRSLKQSIEYSQNKICSTESDFNKYASNLLHN